MNYTYRLSLIALLFSLVLCSGCAGKKMGKDIGFDATLLPTFNHEAVKSLNVPATSQETPVQAAAVCTIDSEDPSMRDLWVKVDVEDGFYVHAYDEEQPEAVPVAIDVPVGSGLEAAGELEYSPASLEDGVAVYRHQVLLHGRYRANPQTSGQTVQLAVQYQACSANACLPPKVMPVSVTLP